MQICKQAIINYTYTNIKESEPDWTALTSYAIGDQVRDGTYYWKCAVAIPDTNVLRPSNNLTKWGKTRPSNRYAMIDESSRSVTTNNTNTSGDPTEGIIVVFENAFYNTIAFGNLLTDQLKIEFSSDDFVTIDETIIWENPWYINPATQTNKWYYRYGTRRSADMPYAKYFAVAPRFGKIRVTIAPSTSDNGLASCGYMVAGIAEPLGLTKDDVKISFKDWSVYDEDPWGGVEVEKRQIQQILDITTYSDKAVIMDYIKIVRKLLGTTVLLIGDESDDSIFENLIMLALIKKNDASLKGSADKNLATYRFEEKL